MIVLSLTNCPASLRGDLSRWLFEVEAGLYVGNQTSRVRDKIWERITVNIKNGRAIMVYPDTTEQGFNFQTCGTQSIAADFDGLTLMISSHLNNPSNITEKRKVSIRIPDEYIAINITEKSLFNSLISEISLAKVCNDQIYDTLTLTMASITAKQIEQITLFINESKPFVSLNSSLDTNALHALYLRNNLEIPSNSCYNIIQIKKMLEVQLNFHENEKKIEDVIETKISDDPINNCKIIVRLVSELRRLYDKLSTFE